MLLDCGDAAFPGPDSDCFKNIHGPDLAVTGTPGVGTGDDDIQDVVCLFVRGQDLYPDLGQQVHVVLGTAVHLGVARAAGRSRWPR